jgi:2-dehydro-3-deoxygalactonokinase
MTVHRWRHEESVMSGDWIAVDWGSTNRRALRIDADGTVVDRFRDDRGVLAVAGGDFAAEAATIRARLGDQPMLCAGMVGSNRGWADAGYVKVPAGIDALAAGLCWVEPGRTAIVPGVCRSADGRADVMRGEEVLLLGAVAAGLVPADALVVQPGTHAKWATLAGGLIADFTTAMVGEMFSLLGKGSLLADGLDLPAADGAAFRAGVARGANGDLLSGLFGARAALVLGQRDRSEQASYVSGLLIGSDAAVRLAGHRGVVHVLAEAGLGGLYAAAIEALGHRAVVVDSTTAFVTGISAIWQRRA